MQDFPVSPDLPGVTGVMAVQLVRILKSELVF